MVNPEIGDNLVQKLPFMPENVRKYGNLAAGEVPMDAEERAKMFHGIARLTPLLSPIFDRTDAACRVLPPVTEEKIKRHVDIFFSHKSEVVDTAIKTCLGCMAISECLHFAAANGVEYGVWGGVDWFLADSSRNEKRDRITKAMREAFKGTRLKDGRVIPSEAAVNRWQKESALRGVPVKFLTKPRKSG
jgi:hypothetical protein